MASNTYFDERQQYYSMRDKDGNLYRSQLNAMRNSNTSDFLSDKSLDCEKCNICNTNGDCGYYKDINPNNYEMTRWLRNRGFPVNTQRIFMNCSDKCPCTNCLDLRTDHGQPWLTNKPTSDPVKQVVNPLERAVRTDHNMYINGTVQSDVRSGNGTILNFSYFPFTLGDERIENLNNKKYILNV